MITQGAAKEDRRPRIEKARDGTGEAGLVICVPLPPEAWHRGKDIKTSVPLFLTEQESRRMREAKDKLATIYLFNTADPGAQPYSRSIRDLEEPSGQAVWTQTPEDGGQTLHRRGMWTVTYYSHQEELALRMNRALEHAAAERRAQIEAAAPAI